MELGPNCKSQKDREIEVDLVHNENNNVCNINYNSCTSPRIFVLTNGLRVESLVDSGAGRSICHENVYKKLPKRAQELKPNEIKLLDVHGNEIETIGTITLEMDFEGKIITQDLIVSRGIQEDILLGIDAITKHNIVIHGGKKK